MNWFWQKKKAVVKPVAVLPMPQMGMDLRRWKSRPSSIEWARNLFETSEFKEFYSVLIAERPKGYAENASQQLGRMNGYDECIRLMEFMAQPAPESAAEIETTWGAEKVSDGE